MKFNNQYLPPLKTYQYLIPREKQLLFKKYMAWIRLLSLRGFHQKYVSSKTFNLLYKAVSKSWSSRTLLGTLQQEFIKENLSLSLLLEPLDGFEWLSKNRYPLNYTTSSPILLQIIAPITRLIAVLNAQHPTFYQPFSSLICAYLALYLVENEELQKVLLSVQYKIDEKNIADSLVFLHNEAKYVLPTIKGFRFKLIVAYYLGLYTVLLQKKAKKYKKNIILLDYINAFLYGLCYTLTIKGKKIKPNQL